jgi:uncharacterized protein (TIGR00299 family) protein
MTRVIYWDCFSGASGDMLLGALLDAGLEIEALRAALDGLGLADYTLELSPVLSHGITGSHFDVHDHGHDRPAHNLAAIRRILDGAALSPAVIAKSTAGFEALGRAEAEVHGTTLDEIHFHEVGAVDTLVDVVGYCWAMEHLGIEAVYASALPLGSGTVHTEHGMLPVPAPATLKLLTAAGAPIVPSDARGELVTPTGAALLASGAVFGQPAMTLARVGYGFGSKEFAWPNMVRVWIGEALPEARGPVRWPGRPAPAMGHVHLHEHGHAHSHDHEHAHEHGHAHSHDHEHAHEHGDEHGHEHVHAHEHGDEHGHDHEHAHENGDAQTH